MNTGIHDATNLVWKLAGTIKGWYQPEVLESYSLERHAAAEHLIRIDRDAASLITGDIPPAYNSLGMSADALLSKVMVDNMNFTSGLGVKYGASFLNNPLLNTTVTTGTRAPDALVRAPGPNISLRLQEAVLHAEPVGSWTILVFGGYHTTTSALVSALGVKLKCAIKERTQMIRLATIIASPVGSAWAAFGGPAPGHLYFDFDGSAHSRYGVSLSSGAVVVIRPDGIIGYATGLDGGDGVAAYLTKVFL
jgi:phenol 2-monooxygenase